MPLPTTHEMMHQAAVAIAEHAKREHDQLVALLGMWVSEIEPNIIYRHGIGLPQIEGLGIKGDPANEVIIENPAFRPAPSIFDLILPSKPRRDLWLLESVPLNPPGPTRWSEFIREIRRDGEFSPQLRDSE